MNARDEIQKLLDTLARQRDELMLRAHLAKADARDELDRMEAKWASLKAKADQARDVAEDAGKEIVAASRLLAEEIREGYERLRKLF